MLVLAGSGAIPTARLAWTWWRQWRQLDGRALARARAAGHETGRVAVRGYTRSELSDRVRFCMAVSIVAALGAARTTNYVLDQRRPPRPLANLRSDRHVHHFLPGIALAFASGALGLVTSDEALRVRLALALGIGIGLTLDESSLLLELEDVYWRSEDLAVAQAIPIAFAAALVALRFIRRGEGAAAPLDQTS